METTALGLIDGKITPSQAPAHAHHKNTQSFIRTFTRHFMATPQDLYQSRRNGCLRLKYGAPFDPELTLRYLGRDTDNQAEVVEDNAYRRYFPIGGTAVPITLELHGEHCQIQFPTTLRAEEILQLKESVVHVLGLRQPLKDFRRRTESHPMLGAVVRAMPGVRLIQTPTLWEALSWAILGQQINLAFAYKLRNRLIYLAHGHAEPVERPIPFPTPSQMLTLTPEILRGAQFSRQKIDYLFGLAHRFETDGLAGLSLERLPPEEIEATLIAIRGLGPWTVAYGMMRGLGYMDALPVGDAGLRQALRIRFKLDEPPDRAAQEALMEPFRPYRSLATYYLWKSLDPANMG